MIKAQKKFRRTAILMVFVLLTALLSVINIINFTMVGEDADRLTQRIADHGGFLGRDDDPAFAEDKGFGSNPMKGHPGPMGPGSPDMNMSIRYFTFAFSEDGTTAETVAFRMSAVSEEDAKLWAASLLQRRTGWTNYTYRFRVYEGRDGRTFVTVIDQGRELLPSYRILLISVIGGLLFVGLSALILIFVGKRIFGTLAEADRKQKKFIAGANREFRQPLTILSAETEIIERTGGPTEETRALRRQITRLDTLVEKLGTIGIFDEEDASRSMLSLSEYLEAALDASAKAFADSGKTLRSSIAPEVTLQASPEAISRLAGELVANALCYSLTWASFRLWREGDRILLEASNDASLPDGSADQAFDRFTTLANAAASADPTDAGAADTCENNHAGLGLSYVKEVVTALNGRASARVSGGVFTLRIAL